MPSKQVLKGRRVNERRQLRNTESSRMGNGEMFRFGKRKLRQKLECPVLAS